MPYNLTNWTAVNSFGDILNIANSNTSGWFWTSITYLVFFVLFVSQLGFNWEVALLSSSFVALIISIILVYMGLASMAWSVGVFVGIIIIGIMYIVFSNRYD